MTDQLMSLAEINTFGVGGDYYAPPEDMNRLIATARAAHEWKAKYDARKVEVSAIVEENKSLRQQLATVKALVTALDNAFISSWQSTAAWSRELEAAKKSIGGAE